MQIGPLSFTLPRKVFLSSGNSVERRVYWFISKIDYASCPLKKGLPSHFTWAVIWKKSLLITALFWNLPRYSLFLHRQSRQRMVDTLLMIKINPKYKKLLIFICHEKNRNLACISNKQVINCQICFFRRYNYKIGCFSELHNSSSAVVLIFCTTSEVLEKYLYKLTKTVIFTMQLLAKSIIFCCFDAFSVLVYFRKLLIY